MTNDELILQQFVHFALTVMQSLQHITCSNTNNRVLYLPGAEGDMASTIRPEYDSYSIKIYSSKSPLYVLINDAPSCLHKL